MWVFHPLANSSLQHHQTSLQESPDKSKKADRVLSLQQKIEIIRTNYGKIKSDTLTLEEKIELYQNTQSLIHHVNYELNKIT